MNFKQYINEKQMHCWKGYKKKGTKKLPSGKVVNNCVKESSDTFDVAEEGDYIRLKNNTTFATADWSELDVPFKAGTVFEVIMDDEDDMGAWYSVPLVDGEPGHYVNKNIEYVISMNERENIECISKEVYELKRKLTPDTINTFNDIINEL